MRYGFPAPLCKLFAGTALILALLAAPPAGASDELTIVALGDSLTAGYLLGPGEGFPEQLGRALAAAGHENVKVVNAGVSGDTSSGGLARLDWAVGAGADAVIVELGANDALRAIDPQITRKNLFEIVARLKARGLPVLLAGMYAPPNLGRDYGEEFNPIFAELAEREGLVFYPFFLEGVASDPALNLGDGIHPTAEGIAIIVEGILPEVEELIERARESRSAAN
ncbi:MAG: arylesterase [Alphaproteobacteria bacterium HGW-Alphaproteobacteria-3]|nr:MAG: arylesterase [Alphaproteobacteria bacterium HGW-Alphaproteobacteria-3]